MKKYGKQNWYNQYRTKQFEEKPEFHTMDISKRNQYVMFLKNRLIDKEARRALDITDPRFQVGPSFGLTNLPKVSGDLANRYNFKFTDEQMKEMLDTPKVIFATSEYRMKDDPERNVQLNVLHLYMVAPWLDDTSLPLIYRMDILQCPQNENFSGFKVNAIVGGCKDGECQLVGVQCKNRDHNAIYHQALSSMTRRNLCDNTPHEIPGEPVNIHDIADFVFNFCGVEYYQKFSTKHTKITDIAAAFRIKNASIPIPSELVAKTTGGEFLRENFDGREIGDNSQYIRELSVVGEGTPKSDDRAGGYASGGYASEHARY